VRRLGTSIRLELPRTPLLRGWASKALRLRRACPVAIMVAGERESVPRRLNAIRRRRKRPPCPSTWSWSAGPTKAQERQADHRAHRPRRRDSREARVEVGAGLLDGRGLRHGVRLRGPRRPSHKRPPPRDRLFGQRANHHPSSLRRGRDVRDTPASRLRPSACENTYLRSTYPTSSTRSPSWGARGSGGGERATSSRGR
jgi:hypothetical protein